MYEYICQIIEKPRVSTKLVYLQFIIKRKFWIKNETEKGKQT